MSYIDVFISLLAGIVWLLIPDILIPKQDAMYEKKKSLFKKGGFVLLGVSAIHLLILLFNK